MTDKNGAVVAMTTPTAPFRLKRGKGTPNQPDDAMSSVATSNGAAPVQEATGHVNGAAHRERGNGARSENQTHKNSIALTLFASANGSIGKRYALDDAGTIESSTGARMSYGEVNTVEVDGLEGLREQISALKNNETFSFGVMKGGRMSAPLVVKDKLAKNPEAIARDKDHFEFPAGAPGLLLLDFDSHHSPTPPTDLESAIDAICRAVPAFRKASMLWRASSSAHIVNSLTGDDLTGLAGQHIYVPVADASDIKRAGNALFERLWLVGLGRDEVGKAGQLLKRSIVDSSVWQPHRLVFVSEPTCIPPLRREQIPMQLRGDPHGLFDTHQIKELNPDERRRLNKLHEAERQRVAPTAKSTRDAYVQEQAEVLAKATGIDRESAVSIFRAAVEESTLTPDFLLYPEQGEAVKVAQILSDPLPWHGKHCRDPLEPDYRQDKRIAVINTRTGGRPYIYSFAHGGRRFYLQPEREEIRLAKGKEDEVTTQVIHVIRARGEIYESGDHSLVRVCDGHLEPINTTYMQDYLGRICRFMGYARREDDWFAQDTPKIIAEYIMGRHGERQFHSLDATVTTPVLRADGSLLDVPGYDAASKLFYYSEEINPPRIPVNPSIEQAQAALEKLWLPFSQFAFVDELARGVMLAAILTAVMRPALPTAPAFGFDAPSIGSGKTLLARTLAAFAGVLFDVKAPPESDAEMRKYLFACLRFGKGIICLDNFTRPIDGADLSSLSGFLTADRFEDRVLGASVRESLPNRALLLLTGNNMRIVGDIVRRVLIVRIDTQLETPYGRKFSFDPETMVRADRLGYVCAALTLIRAAITHGDTLDTLGLGTPFDNSSTASYEGWDTCAANHWLGVDGAMRTGYVR